MNIEKFCENYGFGNVINVSKISDELCNIINKLNKNRRI